MKRFLAAAMAAFAISAFGDLQIDFTRDAEQMTLQNHTIKQNGKLRTRVWHWSPKDKNYKPMNVVRTSLRDGALIIDASQCTKDRNGGYGIFVVEIYPEVKAADPSIYAGRNMEAAVEISADRPMLGILTPSYPVKGKIYFQMGGNVPILTQWKKIEKRFSVREDIRGEPTWRLTFSQPGILRIRNASITFPEPEKEKPISGNQILNGGAERGFYAISGSDFSNLQGGYYRDWLGEIWKQAMIAHIDDKEAASGKYSFRLEDGGKKYQNWLRFNPVKFTLGERMAVTFKAKSKSGKSRLLLFLAVSTGHGYRKFFEIGPEWKTYRFEIPQFGKPVDGITGNYTAKGDSQCYPTFWVDKTAWLDDLCVWQGAGEVVFENPTPVAISGVLNAPYQKLGESIQAGLMIRNTTKAPLEARVSCEILDYFGRQVEKRSLGSVALSAEGCAEKSYTFPIRRRGAQTLLFHVSAQGKTIDHGFLFGGIGPETGPVKRLALDTDSFSTENFLLPFFRDMRIGTARFWSKLSGKNPVEVPSIKGLHDAGIQIFLNLGLDGKDARYHSFSRHDLSSWRDSIRKHIMPYKDSIDVYEILNEPNIWNGYQKNPDPSMYKEMSPAEYIRVLKTAREIIMEFAPNAKFAGPTTCTTDVAFIASVLKAGGDKYLDIVTEHPYRAAPEMPDYYTDLQNLNAICARYGNKPHWATECGSRSEEMMIDNRITPYIRSSVATNLRMMLTAYAGGAEVYTLFSFWHWGGASSWQLTATGATGKLYEYVPQPVLYGLRTIADLLGDSAKSAGAVFLGFEYKCYLFDNGNERIAVFWKWNGAPVRIRPGTEFKGTFYDLMGNPVSEELEIGESPIYFRTKLSKNDLKKLCLRLIPDDGKVVCGIEVFVTGPDTLEAAVTNRGLKALQGEVSLSLGGKTMKATVPEIAQGETRRIPFRSPVRFSTSPVKGKLNLTLNGQTFEESLSLKSFFTPYIGEITIDGSLTEWERIPGALLRSPDDRIKSPGSIWSAKDNAATAEIKTAWNEEGLYLAVIVNKTEFHPETGSSARLWQGDSLQVAFDPLKNAKRDGLRYDGDDFEYAIGLFNGSPMVYRNVASLALYDSLNKTIGELKGEVETSVRNNSGKTIYEIRFVPRAISPFRLKAGASMRFNVIVNMNNGKERIGWLQLTPGIGETKKPGLFMDLLLMK